MEWRAGQAVSAAIMDQGMYKPSSLHVTLIVTCSSVLASFNIKVDVRHKWIASVVYWLEFLATDPEVRVRFPALPDFLRSSGSGMGFTQPREYN
jgi:hypothetical protein